MPTFDFTDVDVRINSSGILAESASVSTQNDLQELPILGRTSIVGQFSVGPKQSSFSINYYLRTQHDHGLSTISSLKTTHNSNGYAPDTVVVGGITGTSYLQNYSLTISPSEPVKTTARYICYNEISGRLVNKNTAGINHNYDNGSGLAHGFTTFITSPTNYNTLNIYSLQYNCDINWTPIYLLGSLVPGQVHFMGAKETFTFESDIYTGILFSGQSITGYINTSEAVIDLFGLGYLRGVNSYLTSISMSGATVRSNDVVAQLDDFVRIRTEAVNFF